MGVLLLEGEYSVYLNGQAVGMVQVFRRGLYYRFRCRCRISGNHVCRLVVRNGSDQESLGIPVPEGEDFILEKMIPMKRIGNGKLQFELIAKKEPVNRRFVPLSPEEPFRYITRLKDSYLAERDGKIGLMIP